MKTIAAIFALFPLIVFGGVSTGPSTVTPAQLATAGVVTNYTLAQFGGIGDGKRLVDVSCTNGSAQIYSPSAAWASADVGKGCVLYLDSTNRTWLRTTISSVQDSTHITLAANSPATRTTAFVYGTDNCAAISNAVWTVASRGGGSINVNDGLFCFWQDPHQLVNGIGSAGVIQFPAHFIRDPSNKTNHITVEFVGSMTAAAQGISTTSNYPSMSGTIFYYVGQPTNSTVYQSVFDANNSVSDYASENYIFRNITFRQPVNPRVWWGNWLNGGGISLRDFAADVEYPSGYQQGQAVIFQPTNSVQNTYSSGFWWTPAANNNSNVKFEDGWIYGYGTGLRAYEHAKIENVNFNWCGTAIALGGGNLANPLMACHIIGCTYDFAVDGGVASKIPFYAFACENEDYSYTTTFWDTNGILIGECSLSGTIPTFSSGATNLTVSYVNGDGTRVVRHGAGVINKFNSIITSEISVPAANNGLVFDLPNIVDYFSGGNTYGFYDRVRGAFGTLGSLTWTQVPSPDGVGLGNIGEQIYFPSNTLDILATNVSVSILIQATNNSITYPVSYNSGNNKVLIYYANGGQVGWRTVTTAGQVTATANPASGLADGTWHQIVGTYDGTTMRLFIDGFVAGTAAQTGALAATTDSIKFGDTATGSAFAHPQVFNRVLGTNEIYSLATYYGLATTNFFKKISGDGNAVTNLNFANISSNGGSWQVPATVALSRVGGGFHINADNTADFQDTVTVNSGNSANPYSQVKFGSQILRMQFRRTQDGEPTISELGNAASLVFWTTNGFAYITGSTNGTSTYTIKLGP